MGKLKDLLEKYMCSDCRQEYCLHFSKGTVCTGIREAEEEIKKFVLSEKDMVKVLHNTYYKYSELTGMNLFHELAQAILNEQNKKLFGDK